jgi:hypothetical protein
VQVLLVFNEMQFKLFFYTFVLQIWVAVQVYDEFVEKIIWFSRGVAFGAKDARANKIGIQVIISVRDSMRLFGIHHLVVVTLFMVNILLIFFNRSFMI